MLKEMALAFSIKGALDATFKASTKNASQTISDINSETKKLQKNMKDAERAQKLLDQAYKAGGMSLSTYFNRQKDLQKVIRENAKLLGKNAMNMGKNGSHAPSMPPAATPMAGMGEVAMLGGLASKLPVTAAIGGIAGGLKQCIDSAIEFESAMADVKKVVDFDTPQQFKAMESDILNLTKVLPMTKEDIAKIVAAGGQAGIAKEDLLGFAESAAKMGVAFDISADQAGDMMAKWRTAFKMNQQDVVALADKINYLGNTTAAAAPLISDVVTRIGPLGEVGGVASGEIAALGASMVGAGIQSEVAATGIKNLILNMVVGENASKKQAEAFASLGMNAGEMAKRMQTDAKGAIMDVLQAIKELDADKQASTLKTLFGQESIGAISPLLSNLDNLKENFDKVADSSQYAGSMEAEFQARSETTENAIQLLKNAVDRVAVTIGSEFLPYIKDLAVAFANGVDTVAKFTDEHQGLVAVLQGAVVAGGAALAAYKGFVIAQSMATWLKNAAIAQRVLNVAMSLNPIGAVVAAIAGLIAVLVYLWNTNEEFRNAVTSAWDEIWNTAQWVFNGAVEVVESAMTSIRDEVTEAVNWINSTWESMRAFLANPIGATINIAKNLISGGEDVAHNAEGGIYGRGAFLTTFAEDSPEAAIPIDGSKRAETLWQQTGQMMGLLPSNGTPESFWNDTTKNITDTGGNRDAININLSIPVTVNGNANESTVASIQQNIETAVERAMARIQHQRGRVSYA